MQVKLVAHTPDDKKNDTKHAVAIVRCAMYDELLKAHYSLSFSMAGKMAFDRLH